MGKASNRSKNDSLGVTNDTFVATREMFRFFLATREMFCFFLFPWLFGIQKEFIWNKLEGVGTTPAPPAWTGLDLAFEYLIMATWLAYLKSKLLLPYDEEDDFKPSEIAEKLKLQLKKLELIRLLSDQLLRRDRIGKNIFYRGIKGGIKSINNSTYNVTLYELLKAYSSIKVQSIYQKISIPKLPVMTTQEGIKQIKENMDSIADWKKIEELIPKSFVSSNKFKKTGLAAIFSASLELTKDGVINLMQNNLFEDVLIRTARHTPLSLKEK